jgi:branched-chain amino acid transport system substrate-binding protein
METRGRLKPTSRRNFIKAAAAGGTALAIGLPAPAILAQTKTPIRIGLLNSFSGVIAYSGTGYWNATQLYFDKIGWKIAGRKVEFLREDDQMNPQMGLQKAKKFVEQDKVDLVAGPQASNVAMAVMNYAKQANFFYLVSGAGTSAITWERMLYMFRSSLSGWQLSSSIANYNYNNLAKEMVLAASDYAGGRDVLAEFRVAYAKLGGKVMKEIYPPLGTTDFSAYLTDIKSLNPPATYDFFVGSDAVRYVKQYRENAIKGPVTGFAGIVDPTTFEGQGDAALGIYCAILYSDTLDTPVNKIFAPAYYDRFKTYTDMFSEYGYTAAQCIDEAGKMVDGDFGNKDKLAAAMKKLSFDAPRGPFRMDPETHNPIQDVYISQVKKLASGRLANVAIHTYKDVRDPGVKQI